MQPGYSELIVLNEADRQLKLSRQVNSPKTTEQINSF